jgi:hypothetical protein
MRTIKIEVENDQQAELLQMLANVAGMRVVDDAKSEEDLARARAIIDAGTNMSKEELDAFLQWHEEDRTDRPLPFRS